MCARIVFSAKYGAIFDVWVFGCLSNSHFIYTKKFFMADTGRRWILVFCFSRLVAESFGNENFFDGFWQELREAEINREQKRGQVLQFSKARCCSQIVKFLKIASARKLLICWTLELTFCFA